MSNNDKVEFDGVITKVFPGAKFEVEVSVGENKHYVRCGLSGKLRQNYIKIIQGDSVTIAVSPYDLTNGIITWRNK